MSTDTVGFLMTENKDFWKISLKISEVLRKYNVASPNFTLFPESRFANIDFAVREIKPDISFYEMQIIERRSLSLHFGCDGNYSDIAKGSKIIWTLGAWGKSKEIVMDICKAMVEFGKVYFTEADTSDKWIKIKA